MHSQYWLQVIFDFLVFIGFSVFSYFYAKNEDTQLILILTGLNCILLHPRAILQYLLQSTGRVKEYAKNTITERTLYCILILFFVFAGYWKYQYMLIADITAKAVTLVTLSITCRDIVFTKGIKFTNAIKEAWKNISVGSKLMFANIASMLIVGIIRYAIQKNWDITTFGKVSFSLNISNLVLTFISAISIVIFPMIKRSSPEKFPQLYESIGGLMSAMMYVFLFSFYPIKIILSLWLPKYIDAIGYFSILFPICISATRNSLLINTYLNALREEKAMLYLNIVSVCFSAVLTYLSVYLLKNLIFSIVSIIILMVFKCFISDLYLQKKMQMHYSYEVVWDILVTIGFIIGNWVVGGVLGWLSYCVFVLLVFLFRFKKYRMFLQTMQKIIQ